MNTSDNNIMFSPLSIYNDNPILIYPIQFEQLNQNNQQIQNYLKQIENQIKEYNKLPLPSIEEIDEFKNIMDNEKERKKIYDEIRIELKNIRNEKKKIKKEKERIKEEKEKIRKNKKGERKNKRRKR